MGTSKSKSGFWAKKKVSHISRQPTIQASRPFDTANVYSNGESERILGKAIKQLGLPRDEIVVYGIVKREPSIPGPGPEADAAGYVNQYGLSRKHIFESIKHSLERLELDYVDVLQCHRFDYNTPIAETMQALHDVFKAGYARYIEMSSCHAYQFHAMQNYAINNGLTPLVSMQNLYNLIYREEEREMMPTLKPIADVWYWNDPLVAALARRTESAVFSNKSPSINKPVRSKEDNKEVILRIEKIAKDRGINMAQVAIAWVLSKSDITAPIIAQQAWSASRIQLVSAIGVKLTNEEIKHLEKPYVAQPIQGHS
ncbi:Aldo/kereductase family [Rhizoctonia solani]|uniref:Aldo/kereductase family n=1 Tax=Rhizoctonia solani TaxID=456999 RepID=A0A8H7LYR0_9AGAM|nr:Aldo/kereductase family [Rhizoctonia solani]